MSVAPRVAVATNIGHPDVVAAQCQLKAQHVGDLFGDLSVAEVTAAALHKPKGVVIVKSRNQEDGLATCHEWVDDAVHHQNIAIVGDDLMSLRLVATRLD